MFSPMVADDEFGRGHHNSGADLEHQSYTVVENTFGAEGRSPVASLGPWQH